MSRPHAPISALWLILAQWYALLLLVGFESAQSGGIGWLSALPWNSWARELFEGLNGLRGISVGAVLLCFYFALLACSILVLVYSFAMMQAARGWPETGASPSSIEMLKPHKLSSEQPAQGPSEDLPAAPLPAATLMQAHPELAPLLERFRSQLRRDSK